MYLVSHTQDCQQSNEHEVKADVEIAKQTFSKKVDEFMSKNEVTEIFSSNLFEFYCQCADATQHRIYIEELNLN